MNTSNPNVRLPGWYRPTLSYVVYWYRVGIVCACGGFVLVRVYCTSIYTSIHMCRWYNLRMYDSNCCAPHKFNGLASHRWCLPFARLPMMWADVAGRVELVSVLAACVSDRSVLCNADQPIGHGDDDGKNIRSVMSASDQAQNTQQRHVALRSSSDGRACGIMTR